MKKKTNSIEKKLLQIYKKNNPTSPLNLNRRIKTIQKIFEKLSFPLRFLKNLTIGDFACGTGEYCMVAAKNGAKTDGFDLNKTSVDIAKKNSKNINTYLIFMSYFKCGCEERVPLFFIIPITLMILI